MSSVNLDSHSKRLLLSIKLLVHFFFVFTLLLMSFKQYLGEEITNVNPVDNNVNDKSPKFTFKMNGHGHNFYHFTLNI